MDGRRTPGLDAQPAALAGWTDAAAAWTTWAATATQLSLDFWASALGQQPASGSHRSWYRRPAQSPYDLAGWLPGFAGPASPLDWWRAGMGLTPGWPMAEPRGFDALTAWMTALTSLSLPFTQSMLGAMSPAQQWMQLASAWPGTQAVRAEAAPLAPFAFYRSDGGHATAQITFPKMVIGTAVWPVFGLPFWGWV
jgi:hypothetical protein